MQAFLDIKAAFDSIDSQALWKALCSRGVPDILLDLIVAVHESTGVRVQLVQNFYDRLQDRAVCVPAPAVYIITIDRFYGTCR